MSLLPREKEKSRCGPGSKIHQAAPKFIFTPGFFFLILILVSESFFLIKILN
jgi:hypothetical protein